MMMMLFPMVLIFFFKQTKKSEPSIFLSLILYTMCLSVTPPSFYGMSEILSMSLVLTNMGSLMVLMSSLIMFASFFVIINSDSAFKQCHWLMYLSLILIFLMKKMLLFYVFLELSLAPISLIILGWGYQPERSVSFIYMFIYTLTACLPFLAIISQWWVFDFLSSFSSIWCYSVTSFYPAATLTTFLLTILTILGFLVKFPLYALHLWLPKAHVEAPISGSMILAGALLKLGGFGWYLVMSSLMMSKSASSAMSAYAGLGGVLISVICLRQIDMKVIIAYSSVGHLSLVIMAFSSKSSSCYLGGLLVMVAHGFSSPGMFYGANIMYSRSGSRNVLLNPSFLSMSPIISLCWFLVCMANMSAPPSVNLLAEIVTINSVVSSNFSVSLQLAFLVFLSGAYTLALYAVSQQGQKKNKFWYLNPLSALDLVAFFLVTALVYSSTMALIMA